MDSINKPNLKVMVLCFFGLLLTLAFSYPALAAEQTAVTGQAEVSNTGGNLDFSNAKSNVVISNSTNSTDNFSGYAWSEDLGWVDFGAVSVASATHIVSGKATAKNTGSYIDFNASPYHSNVTISESGNFSGYAFSEDIGWINFSGVSSSSAISILPETGGGGAAQNSSHLQAIIPIASTAIMALISFLIYKRKIIKYKVAK